VNIIAEEYRFNAVVSEITAAKHKRARQSKDEDYEEPGPDAPF